MTDNIMYFNGDELAAKVWYDKYRHDGESTPLDMHKRMAKEFARIESNYKNPLSEDEILSYLIDFKHIIPQGSIMSGLGSNKIVSLSNCTVIDSPFDSYGGIFSTDEELAQLMKRRCGVGVDISTLRYNGSNVKNAAGTSSGAVSFLKRFSNTTNEVAQDGRRGALMASIDVSHPDIKEFISVKSDLSQVTGANLSVRISDDFMKAVENVDIWPLEFEGEVIECVDAKELWDLIVKQARDNAEPGILFWDRHHNYSTSSVYPDYKNVSTNPCGEQALQAYDSCRLIASNMLGSVINPYTEDAYFDYDNYKRVCRVLVRLNDDLVDLEIEYIDKIINHIELSKEPDVIKSREINMWRKFQDSGRKGRRIGAGFTGLGDTFAALGLVYGSLKSKRFLNIVMKEKAESEFEESIQLAKERGAFDGFSPKIEETSDFVKMMKEEMYSTYIKMMKYGRRNINISTVAPTGSLSILAGVTSGLEPLFMPYYTRNKKVTEGEVADFTDENGIEWKGHNVIHKQFEYWMKKHYDYDWVDNMDNLSEANLQIAFSVSPWHNSTANDIRWKDRVEIQSIIQKYTTNSISSTINLPENTTEQEVSDIYMESWKMGLKGVTVYRDGSRQGVLVSSNDKKDKDGRPVSINRQSSPKRSKDLICDIHKLTAKGVKYTVLVGKLDDEPYEVFAFEQQYDSIKGDVGILRKAKRGKYDLIINEDIYEDINLNVGENELSLTRMISTSLRHGADIAFIVEQLNKSNGLVVGFTKAIARVLNKYSSRKTKSICPECDSENYIEEGGCASCKDCGYSKCG